MLYAVTYSVVMRTNVCGGTVAAALEAGTLAEYPPLPEAAFEVTECVGPERTDVFHLGDEWNGPWLASRLAAMLTTWLQEGQFHSEGGGGPRQLQPVGRRVAAATLYVAPHASDFLVRIHAYRPCVAAE